MKPAKTVRFQRGPGWRCSGPLSLYLAGGASGVPQALSMFLKGGPLETTWAFSPT